MTDSVRHLQTMRDTMHRYQGEIKRMVDCAGIVCTENGGDDFRCPLGSDCPFHSAHKPNSFFGCDIAGFKAILGEPK
jgi:hypothetical protein